MADEQPLIFDIARGSFVDGPGIRTVVFFSGCPLRCAWCHNPESWIEGEKSGKYYPSAELAELLCRDKTYYAVSKGGVTFSGGEPMFYPRYLRETALLLKKQGIHVAIETSGHFAPEVFVDNLESVVDLVLFDFKIVNPTDHLNATGVSNETILDTVESLSKRGVAIMATIPLIPGYTATKENLAAIAGIMARCGIKDFQINPYNPSGIDKRKKLGMPVPDRLRQQPLSMVEEKELIDYFKEELARRGVAV
jgi:pyruvate formate lyase activating enzyme